RPARVVVRITDRQARIPAVDGSKLPSSHQGVDRTIRRVQEGSALTEWQLPNRGGIDEVANVEVGAVVPIVLANGVDDKGGAIPAPSLQSGCVIQRVGEGVVDVHGQALEALAQRDG